MGAMHNVPPAFAEWLQNQRGGYQPMPGSPLDNVIRTKQLRKSYRRILLTAPPEERPHSAERGLLYACQ